MSNILDRLQILVNEERFAVAPETTVAGLLAVLELDLRKVAVERNREIVPRSTYANVVLNAGDEIEIVHFIGGG